MASPGVVAAPDVLAVLKGFDPDVEEILASSGHVSLYTMVAGSKAWDYKDVEGSLFLLKRRGTPRFRMMVLNKRSTENFTEDVHGELHFEINPPYLMYTHGNSVITGVWFYEQDDLLRFENILMRIKQTAELTQPAAPSRSQTSARPVSKKADDDNFYDKPSHAAAAPSAQQRQQQVATQTPRQQAASSEGSSNLANLLRNAQRKQQPPAELAQSAASSSMSVLPQPMPPSFFAQQQQRAAQPAALQQQQEVPPTAVPVPVPAPVIIAPQAAASAPHVHSRAPQVLIPAAALTLDKQQPTGGQMGGALAKLFANAHKLTANALPQQATPPLSLPELASGTSGAASQLTPHQLPPQPGPAMSAAAGPYNESDEDRVRHLLTRIRANDELVKLLAAEMRAVGLL